MMGSTGAATSMMGSTVKSHINRPSTRSTASTHAGHGIMATQERQSSITAAARAAEQQRQQQLHSPCAADARGIHARINARAEAENSNLLNYSK